MKFRVAFIGWWLAGAAAVSAQSDTLRVFSVEEVRKQNSWSAGDNPVGLSFNRMPSLSMAEVGYARNSGDLGVAALPVSAQEYSVRSESYKRLGKVALYGQLAYLQSRSRGQNWKGMVNDYWQSVNLCDSISGKRRGETYHLEGAFSLPVGGEWIIGLQAGYRVETVAKDTDPRNKNQWSEYVIHPGVGYKTGKCTWGMSLSYADRQETVDYQNMGTHAVYPVLQAYPLSFFKTISRDESVKWNYSGREVGGAMQLGYDEEGMKLFLQLSANVAVQHVESNRIQNRKEAESSSRQAGCVGKLQASADDNRHEWSVRLAYEANDNYDPIQEQEANGIWRCEGKILRSTRKTGSCELTYEYRRMRDEWNPRFGVLSGMGYRYQENALLFYPVKYLQPLSRFTFYMTFFRSFVLSKACLDCSIGGRYGAGGGTLLKEQRSGSGEPAEKMGLWQDEARLQQDYDYQTSSRLAMEFSVTYIRKNPLCWFAKLSGGYEYSEKCRFDSGKKKVIASIGLIF